MTQACLGGWCRKRNQCANYRAEDRREPAERLCVPGADGVGRDVPVFIRTPVEALEQKQEVEA